MYLPYTYLVRNKITEEYYYGSRCKNVKLKRTPEEDFWIKYFTSSKKVKALITKYGLDSFEVHILLKDEDYDKCYFYEQELINEHLGKELCLNRHCRLTGKFSIAGEVRSAQTVAKIRESNTGQTRTDEAKTKMSLAQMGEKNHNYGKSKSEETKIKMGASRKGKPGRPVSDETKLKISATMKGRPAHNKGNSPSEETKVRISIANKGRPAHNKGKKLSIETRAKISASMKNKVTLLTTAVENIV